MRALKRLVGFAALIVFGVVVGAPSAEATLVTSLVGDKDGFGLTGAPAVPISGTWSGFGGGFPDDNRGPGDPAFTDIWGFEQTAGGPLESPISWTHDLVLPGAATSASLTINEAGMSDDRGPWSVIFNGTNIGQIGVFPGSYGQTFQLLTFSIPAALIMASNTVSLNYADTVGEGFAINFVELNVEVVPEPATLTLLGLGLLGAGFSRRRRR